MWQNLIASIARNPVALKALADLVAPTLRTLLKQETSEDVVSLRRDLDAIGSMVTKDVPYAINGLGARQQEIVLSVETLRQEVQSLARGQQEREAALAAEVARLSRELESAQAALRLAQETGVVPAAKRRFPW